MEPETPYLVRAKELAELPEIAFQHPLNPKSEIHMRSLGDHAGLQRIGLHLGRVPPGKESFVYHFHHFEEEFVYVIAGRGLAEIGDATYEVGPGDVMLFPARVVGHHLRNPFTEDLVYLMGGERHDCEIGEFPRLGKRAVFERGHDAYVVDLASIGPFFKGED
jgi:uncharacterized cupin superfamily protein